MQMKNYLMINKETNIVDNVCAWDGNEQTWTPPANYLMLLQEATVSVIWQWSDETQSVELIEKLGNAGIGFTWDGSKCVTNQPKPTV